MRTAYKVSEQKLDSRVMKAMRALDDHERFLCDEIAIETAANAILHDMDCMLGCVEFTVQPGPNENVKNLVCQIESWGVGVESQRFHAKTLTLQVDCERFLVRAWIR